MQIRDVVTAARSPWQNAYVERFIGSIRRRMPRSRHRRECRRAAAHREELRRLLHALADASQPRQGFAHSAADRAVGGPAASSRFQRSTGCTIATTASPPSRRRTFLVPVTSLHGSKGQPHAALSMSALAPFGNGSPLAEFRQRSPPHLVSSSNTSFRVFGSHNMHLSPAAAESAIRLLDRKAGPKFLETLWRRALSEIASPMDRAS